MIKKLQDTHKRVQFLTSSEYAAWPSELEVVTEMLADCYKLNVLVSIAASKVPVDEHFRSQFYHCHQNLAPLDLRMPSVLHCSLRVYGGAALCASFQLPLIQIAPKRLGAQT